MFRITGIIVAAGTDIVTGRRGMLTPGSKRQTALNRSARTAEKRASARVKIVARYFIPAAR
jgi:hypothetical protein